MSHLVINLKTSIQQIDSPNTPDRLDVVAFPDSIFPTSKNLVIVFILKNRGTLREGFKKD